jgi:hypothetical protein
MKYVICWCEILYRNLCFSHSWRGMVHTRSAASRRPLSTAFQRVQLFFCNIKTAFHFFKLNSKTIIYFCWCCYNKHLHPHWVENTIFFFLLRCYNFREVLAFSTSFFHSIRFLMQSFQFVIFILIISLFTSSSHLFLGLPSDLVSAGDYSYTFFTMLLSGIRCTCRTKLVFVLWCSLWCFYYQSVYLVLHSI